MAKNGGSRAHGGCAGCLLRIVVLATLWATAALFLRELWLPIVARALLRDDAPRPGAPILLLLMGGIEERPGAAADAYLSGRAQNIMVAYDERRLATRLGLVDGESEKTVRILQALGVPDNAITKPWEHEVTSTVEEAAVLTTALKKMSPRPKRVVVLTSWFHTRRAAKVFEKQLAGTGIAVEAMPASPGQFTPSDWWHSELGMIMVFEEYVKTALYYWRGQI